jgi:hypothetical protein
MSIFQKPQRRGRRAPGKWASGQAGKKSVVRAESV